MATLNWPGFGIASIAPAFDLPSQVNRSAYTGVRAVASNPWHGKWSFKVQLAVRQGDANFQAIRAFFTQLQGQINNFHLPAVEAPQNANTGVTLSANAAQGATSIALTGLTTALVAGNMVTIAGQLLSLTSVGTLSGAAQTVSFQPALRAAASSGASVETAKPYALVALSTSSFSWDIATWRQYGLSFECDEDVSGTDGADPALDVWTGTVGGGGGGGSSFSFPQLSSFTTRSLLAAVPSPTDKQVAYLTEAGREGEFVFSTANLSTLVSADTAQGVYVAPAADTSGASGAWVRKFSGFANVKWFGAKGDGTTNDSAAFAATLSYLKSVAGNLSANGFYKSSTALYAPAGRYYFGTTPIDVTFGVEFIGDGGGGRANSSPATAFVWADGTSGIRVQNVTTSGDTTIDGVGHFGAGIFVMRGIGLVGGYAGTEGNYHAIDAKAPFDLSDFSIDSFSGEGINALGNIGSLQRNVSASVARQGRITNCRIGFKADGPDANVVKVLDVEFINNRQAGYWDNSSIGSNSVRDCHFSGNSLNNLGSNPKVQCTYSGNHYAVVLGQESGASTNAPSGTTADNTWWYYIEAGTAASYVPTWTSGLTWRAGGDVIIANGSAGVTVESYFEDGTFQQFGANTLSLGGRLSDRYYRGGMRWNADLITAGSLANDAAAASFGFQKGRIYRNGSVLQVRVT